ncbi:MAG: hypothetical protein HOL22_05385 [Euryarchaeota archaeon]|jgi:hypothetical protein|nr:hypothetical protein [Euryarchaeota archaeon]HJL96773.1 hypothetical protein [Candidatus Poseidoniaceae archaeon]MBT5594174.1 hypothetical protein [Euryarchaeota archaeon]MBT5844124.1 hypothetical protein [Euryarchaeota archaeon]MBT6641037.1 hypothetical protein [Euryarchaeota archaeon]
MGLSFTTVQRMFIGSFLAALLAWYFQCTAMDAAWTFIGLSSLTGIVWGLSEKDITFDALGLNSQGVLVMFSFVASIAIFAEICIGVFDFPTIGSYGLSLCFIGTFWWTGALIQPSNN